MCKYARDLRRNHCRSIECSLGQRHRMINKQNDYMVQYQEFCFRLLFIVCELLCVNVQLYSPHPQISLRLDMISSVQRTWKLINISHLGQVEVGGLNPYFQNKRNIIYTICLCYCIAKLPSIFIYQTDFY